MCDKNCTCNENIEESELTQEQMEQLESVMGELGEADPQEEMFPIYEMDMADYDEEEFRKGIKSASFISGFFTACKNAGMYSADIMSILINRETIEHNIKCANINKVTSIEVSKNQANIVNNNTL